MPSDVFTQSNFYQQNTGGAGNVAGGSAGNSSGGSRGGFFGFLSNFGSGVVDLLAAAPGTLAHLTNEANSQIQEIYGDLIRQTRQTQQSQQSFLSQMLGGGLLNPVTLILIGAVVYLLVRK